MIVVQLRQQKRKRRWPWVLLVFLIILLIPPIALFLMVYDPDTKTVKIQDNFSLETFANRAIVDSLDHTAEEPHHLSIAVTENDMDNILISGLKNIPMAGSVVSKAYVIIKGEKYDFYADFDFDLFKTRLKMATTLKDDTANNQFIFKIEDISVGQIFGLKEIGKSIFGRYINSDTINQFIEASGLSIKYSSDDSALFYNKDDILSDLTNLLGGGTGMFVDIIQTMFDQKLFSFTSATDNFIEANVDLSRLASNELVTDDADHLAIAPQTVGLQCRDRVVTLVNNNAINPDETDVNIPFKFFFKGYDNLDDSEKNVIDYIDMTSVGISNAQKSTYPGIYVGPEIDIVEKMKESISPTRLWSGATDEEKKFITQLTEKDVNEYIRNKSVIGYTTLLHRRTEDGYKINYVCIDNFYCNLYNKGTGLNDKVAEFVCKININGYHTSLTFDSRVSDVIANNKLTFTVKDIKYGSMEAEELKDQFFDVIAEALKGTEDNSLTADTSNYTFSFDFNYIINQAKQRTREALVPTYIPYWPTQLEEAFNGENVNIDVYGATRDELGSIKLTLRKTLQEYILGP